LSNVSIVHYDLHVAKEDREAITPQVCFSFCRTVPDMSFFGILNGNQCYCTPYYQSIEGDDSMCDVVCEGDATQVCGSKTKSSLFGMHSCNNMESDLSESTDKMAGVLSTLQGAESNVSAASGYMQAVANQLQDLFGKSADPVAANLMQTAKQEAGKLEKIATEAAALASSMSTEKSTADGLAGGDFTSSETMESAEGSMRKIEELAAEGVGMVSEMQLQMRNTEPVATENASQLYYPVMYFVDKKFADSPSTCGGASAHDPIIGDIDACATACNKDFQTCVGFSFFPADGRGLCFLFSKLKTATYYTKCQGVTSQLMEPKEVQCMVKFSKFEGTTLKPDGSGKCEQCLKEATHADRCFV